MRKRAWNNIVLFRPTPAVPNTINVTVRSLILTTIIDIGWLTQDQFSQFPASDFPINQSAAPELGSSREDLRGLVTGLSASKCFHKTGPDDTDAFLLLPITGLFTERDNLVVGSGRAT